jgi:predicted metal-binding protein
MKQNIVVLHPRRAPPVFVCRKCLKRSADATNVGRALKSEMKRRASGGLKPARLIKTSCFGICPKHAVVTTGGAAAGNGDYVLISSKADVAEALDRLRDGSRPTIPK